MSILSTIHLGLQNYVIGNDVCFNALTVENEVG